METRMDSDFDSAMQFALKHLAHAKVQLAVASWASPDTFDAVEQLRKHIDTLAKQIKREQERWRREHAES